MLAVAVTLSLAIGVVLGMLGGGGAILTLPMLVYAVGVEPKAAIAMSLFVVGATSLVSTAVHARAGRVRWKLGAVFGGAAMAGAFVGGRLAQFVPGAVLLLVFALFMVATATAMLRKGRGAPAVDAGAPRIGRALALGAGVGVLSGLVGAGGGFLIVPALTIFAGFAMHEAIGTSLFVIALQSFAGFAGHATHTELDWRLVAAITVAAIVGSLGGASVAGKLPADRLRKGFAWLVIAMGLFVFAKQLPTALAVAASVVSLLGVLAVSRAGQRA